MNAVQIVDGLLARDEKALCYLYEHYGAAINGIITRILKSENLAEEVLQQTFLKIWDKIETYDSAKSTLFTWMARIARNSAIDVTRLKSYQNNYTKTESLDLSIHNNQKSVINESSIDAHSLIKKLEEKHRIILDYIYLQGYTQSQVAKELDIPLGTVKTRVRKAIMELREYLKSEESLFTKASFLLLLLITYICL